jgi:hypothetical protein
MLVSPDSRFARKSASALDDHGEADRGVIDCKVFQCRLGSLPSHRERDYIAEAYEIAREIGNLGRPILSKSRSADCLC